MIRIPTFIALLMTLLFSPLASAVIIEGTFSGYSWDILSNNMDVTPDAKFWAANGTGWGGEFTGSFWYDTDLAGAAIIDDFGYGVSATYNGTHNWLHTTLRVHGQNIEMTSSGAGPTYSATPREQVIVTQNRESFSEQWGIFSLEYVDYNPFSGERSGYLSLNPYWQPYPFLDGLKLDQTFSLHNYPEPGYNYLGYMQFSESGVIDGIAYDGLWSGEINDFEIHVRVPEPSPLLLLCSSLLMLYWRFGRKSFRIENRYVF